jgi:hypothetical protein
MLGWYSHKHDMNCALITYAVAVVRANFDLSYKKERIVVGDAFDQKASCNCE